MSIDTHQEYEQTQTKLRAAQRMLSRIEAEGDDSQAAAASQSSLRAYVNQLFEELRRYEIGEGLNTTSKYQFTSPGTSSP